MVELHHFLYGFAQELKPHEANKTCFLAYLFM